MFIANTTFIGGGSVFWSALEAVGTFLTVIVALFQNQIRQWINRPLIEISFKNEEPWCRDAIEMVHDAKSLTY